MKIDQMRSWLDERDMSILIVNSDDTQEMTQDTVADTGSWAVTARRDIQKVI